MAERANGMATMEELIGAEVMGAEKSTPTPVPQTAWQTLERLHLAAQVSQQQLQAFVDGLALGQGMANGAQLQQLQQGGWAWTVKELSAEG